LEASIPLPAVLRFIINFFSLAGRYMFACKGSYDNTVFM